MSQTDPAPTGDLSSDAITLACGVASGGEALVGQRLPDLYFGPKGPAGEEAAGLNRPLAKTVEDGLQFVDKKPILGSLEWPR